jgi:hypothetical protein
MRFFFITNSPEVAAWVARRGVSRLFVDLELIGKKLRQGHLSTVISGHTFADLATVRGAAPDAEVMARLNPLNDASASEVDLAVAIGTDILMLPMYRTAAEAARFCELVRGRARVCLLVETAGAMEALADTLTTAAPDEVHIGLNDLHLDMGNSFMFEPLVNGSCDRMAATLRDAGVPFGIGGIARTGEGAVPAELLLGEHVRLGSTAAILSRSFHRGAASVTDLERDFVEEIGKLNAAYASWAAKPAAELDALHDEVRRRVTAIAEQRRVTTTAT